MTKKVYKIVNIIPFIIFFAAIFYYSMGVCLKGDDLLYLLRSSYNFVLPEEQFSSFSQVVQSAYFDYMIQDARFISTIVCTSVLRFDLKLYQILNPIILTAIYYIGLKTISKDEKFDNAKSLIINSLALMLFFSLSPSLLEDSVFWVTGATFYAWTLLSAIMMIRLIIYPNPKFNLSNFIFWFFVVLRLSFSTENLSLSISIILVVVTIYNCWFKKNKSYFTGTRRVMFILFLVFNFMEMMSPGSHSRADQLDFSIISTVINGLTYYIKSQYIVGGAVPIILLILIFTVFRKYNKALACSALLYSLPYFIVISLYVLPVKNDILYNNLFFSFIIDPCYMFNAIGGHYIIKFFVLFYFGSITLLIASMSLFTFIKEKNEMLFLLIILSAITNLALIPLGGAAERTSLFSQIFMIFTISLILYKEISEKHIEKVVILAFIFSSVLLYSKNRYLRANVQVNRIRENIYKEVINGNYNSKEIIIPKFRFTLLGNYDSYYSFGDKFLIHYLKVDDDYSIIPVDRSEFGIK